MDKPSLRAAGTAGRRRLLGGVVGGAALAALAGGVWWRLRAEQAPEGAQHEAPAAELVSFWSTPWLDPTGQALPVQSFQGRPLLINFWATWCPPCVDELPLLNAFFRQNKAKGWQVLGLAVDRADMVQRFLRQNPVDFPVAMAGIGGTDLARAMGNPTGGLPFTVVVGGSGAIVQRRLGRVTSENLQQWAGLK